MTHRLLTAAALALTSAAIATPADAQDEKRLKEIEYVIATMTEKDSGMVKWFKEAYGYAVFPNVGKAGLGIGGAHGNGIVYQAGNPVGKTELKQVTVGFQAGGQSFVEVVFFKDKTAFDDFTRGNFEFGAQVSAVAFTAGASAKLAYNGGVAIVTMAKGGLMYEATVGGQKFKYEAYEKQ
jgi:lipid-binding SYLF domain-containing protein